MLNFTALPPLSLYVHVPWCIRKCPYCDFNSHASDEKAIPEAAYVDALIRDLEHDLPAVWGRSVDSIFIGGGTPSLLSGQAVERLLSATRARLPLKPGLEVTLEANPGTLDREKLAAFRAAGVTRLSLGVQSFNDAALQRLGRIHDADQALETIEAVSAAGFESWNLDLMYGLPGQTIEQALDDIRAAVACAPPHLSHYQLTIEPNTLFHARPPRLPAEDDIWTMHQQCQEHLIAHGLQPYEISACARDRQQCLHNLNYWRFGDYLGIGAGAHAKISNAHHGCIERSWKVRHPRQYMERLLDGKDAAAHIGERRRLEPADVILEFMMNAFRLNEGFPASLFQQHTGLPLALAEPALRQGEERGLIARDAHTIRPTPLGLRFLNDLLALFMDDNPAKRHIAIVTPP